MQIQTNKNKTKQRQTFQIDTTILVKHEIKKEQFIKIKIGN